MRNPFYLKPLPLTVPFCDREKEIDDLVRHSENLTNVVLSSPRRYGKTSLIKRVQNILGKKETVIVYVDYFGVTSVDEFVSRFASGVYSVIYEKKSIFEKAVKIFTSLRPVIKLDPETGLAITVEIARGKSGMQLLEETMRGFGEFLKSGRIKCNVAFDEFQEITELKESKSIEGTMRSYIQDQQNVSYFFIGSRRRILSDIFNDKKRPFYKSAINYVLPPLPLADTVKYLGALFKKSGKKCPEDIAQKIHDLSAGYPYYVQKLSYFIFDTTKNKINDKHFHEGLMQMLSEETPLLEMMLQNLRPGQISFLSSLAKEPTDAPFTTEYINRHHLGSLGGVQAAIKKLLEMDYIEKTSFGWKVVDPIFALWLRKKETME
ncbi:MAG: ATP-binding protein [Elusimicrobiota bacterium]